MVGAPVLLRPVLVGGNTVAVPGGDLLSDVR
jgi:hypothetical protein